MMEGEYIIGAMLNGQSVTLEPGGQFELSGGACHKPLKTTSCSLTNPSCSSKTPPARPRCLS
jgi:gamma-glutamylcysteine synthetase